MPLLEVEGLSVRFPSGDRASRGRDRAFRAVDGASFALEAGETLALVGESGSGKSVTSLAILGLVPAPGVIEAGAIRYAGRDLVRLPRSEMRRIRGREIAIVLQEPASALNPWLTIGAQLCEALEIHRGWPRAEARHFAAAALSEVGIASPEERLDAYPHELSGGLRQRVTIAMALLLRPKVLLADEPTTALDVTIQAQVLDLLKAMQRRHGTSILLVTHSLGVVAGVADRVAVMYAGRIVETAPTRELFARPRHPYTLGLLESVPRLDRERRAALGSIPGQPPDPTNLPSGCAFAPRCAYAIDRCAGEVPALEGVGDLGRSHDAACFRARELGSIAGVAW